ncbi:MAG: asparagine synthase (glutamine-hydrolyzing) [Desulfuromonadales bacterium]
MCGIAGILQPQRTQPATEILLRRMITLLRHRGPDACGIYLDRHIGLAHCRLSIIGIDGGNQPIGNESGDLWIVFNGEIFNYIELRSELLAQGHRFATETDSEVLLHLYEEWGDDCLQRLNGQFAFAIWDARREELFLARDRVGIRPLFYWREPGKLLFASEIKALFADREIPREIDPRALEEIFTFWGNLPPATIFRGVRELPPGSFLRVTNKSCVEKRFWRTPLFAPEERWRGSFAEAAEELRRLLVDAIRLRLRADVPVGAYLSGGLDSSIITALISHHFNREVRTFSMGFGESGYDESRFQTDIAAHLGVRQQRLEIDNAAIGRHLAEVLWHCEKPLLRSSPVPLYLLSGLVRDHGYKVVLSGEGADEVFGGYNIFREAKVRRFWLKNPGSMFRPLLLERLYPYIFTHPARSRSYLRRFFAPQEDAARDPFFSHRVRWENSRKNTTFFSPALQDNSRADSLFAQLAASLPENFAGSDTLAQAQFLEIETFLANYLLSTQGDRVGMAHSVEMRMPFLDHRLIEFGMRLPAHWKIRGMNEKYILKRAFGDMIPAEIVSRPKQPYRAPIHTVILSGRHDYVREMLSEAALLRSGLFDAAKVPYLLKRLSSGKNGCEFQNMALIGILSTQILHQRFVADFPLSIPLAQPDRIIRKGLSRGDFPRAQVGG